MGDQPLKTVFAAYLNTVDHRDVSELRLGKKAETLMAEAEKLDKQLNQYSYGPPAVRFGDVEIDRARAAGVLLELEHNRGRRSSTLAVLVAAHNTNDRMAPSTTSPVARHQSAGPSRCRASW